MSAPEILERQRRIAVADYHRMIGAGILREDEHVQLLDGVLVTMTPQGSPHAFAVQRLNRILVQALGDEYAVRPQLPLTLGEHSEPEPDLAVVRSSDAGPDRHPRTALLVVEVAGESLRLDRGVKSALYAAADVPEYWIVNLPDRVIEVHRDPRPAEGRYAVVLSAGAAETVSAAALPGVSVRVADVLG